MPKVPPAQVVQEHFQGPMPSPAELLMAAASMHQQGRLFMPEEEMYKVHSEELPKEAREEMNKMHIEEKPRQQRQQIPRMVYKAPPK
jgi:hypothetical protein